MAAVRRGEFPVGVPGISLKVLEKVRGIVEEWDKSKHRSAGADSWGSMAQIQAALMP